MDAMDEESLKLVLQLMQEEIAVNESGGAASEKHAGAGESVDDETKKKQEELDMQIAMEIQNALNAQQPPKPVYVPPPVPFGGSRYKPDHSEVKVPPSAEAIKRLIADLREVVNCKDPTIHVHPDPDDITHISALIIGPEGTPYEGGFFHFEMYFPHDYPWRPPKVNLETTDGGTVRFNPNLYACGKGTWSGPSWTEIQTMLSTLLSIQSLMNEKPYHNEPGHEVERNPKDVTDYNDCIEHETLRVAVIGMMENPTTPAFMSIMEESFLQNYDKYMSWIEKRRDKDGRQMRDPFGESRGMFKYSSFLPRLQKLKDIVEKRREEAKSKQLEDKIESDSSDSEEEEEEEEEEAMVVTTTTTSVVCSEQPTATTVTGSSDMDLEVAAVTQTATTPAGPAPTPTPLPDASSEAATNPFAAFFSSPASAPATTNTSEYADPDYLLALQLQAQLDGDAELAQQLQNEMNQQQQQTQSGFTPAPAAGFGPPQPFIPVKPPTLAELKAEATGDSPSESAGADDNYDPNIVCLICKQSPLSYIVLPSCEQPHIYCYPCAEKRAKMPSDRNDYNHRYYGGYRARNRYDQQSGQSLTCVLCNAVSHLGGDNGLKALRRHRKRKREGSQGWCSEHKEEMSLYCMDDHQLICLLCAGSTHANHNYEALETAQTKLQPEVRKGLRELENKWGKLEQFVKEVEQKQSNLEVDMGKKRRKAKEEIDKLRRLLDDKEKEIDNAITNVYTQKQHNLKSKLDKAKSALEKIPGAIATVQGIIEERSALSFLQRYEDNEQDTRDLCNVPVPAVGRGWFTMPPLVVDHIEQLLKQSLKYQSRPNTYGMHPFGMVPEENDDDYDEQTEENENVEEEAETAEAMAEKDETPFNFFSGSGPQ